MLEPFHSQHPGHYVSDVCLRFLICFVHEEDQELSCVNVCLSRVELTYAVAPSQITQLPFLLVACYDTPDCPGRRMAVEHARYAVGVLFASEMKVQYEPLYLVVVWRTLARERHC